MSTVLVISIWNFGTGVLEHRSANGALIHVEHFDPEHPPVYVMDTGQEEDRHEWGASSSWPRREGG